MNTKFNMLKLDIELTLKSIKPYNKNRDIDNDGHEIRLLSDGSYLSVDYKPFWL